MPKKIPFKLVQEFDSEDLFKSGSKELNYSWAINATNYYRCTVCDSSNHNMKVQYGSCSNADCNKKGIECGIRYKIHTCLKYGAVQCFSIIF